MQSSQVLLPEGGVRDAALVNAMRDARFRYPDDIVLCFLAGSHQHGARLEGKSDVDMAGVYVEPPVKVMGLDIEEHFTHNTSDNSRRNTSDDEDFKLYSLRHWCRLAAKGNPTILSFLFTPSAIVDPATSSGNVWWSHIIANRSSFLARSHANAFIGYGRAQLHRMQGLRGAGKHGQRPELEEQFGYDTKAAMHMIRLMYEVHEVLSTGNMTFPRPEKDVLLDIRLGRWSQTRVEQEYLRLESLVQQAEAESPLPPKVDRVRISEIVTDAYLQHWRSRAYLK